MKRILLLVTIAALCGCAAPARQGQRSAPAGKPAPAAPPPPAESAVISKPVELAIAHPVRPAPDIPREHMPPKGKCRVWYEGRSPAQQPPVGECAALERNIPKGAVLVRG